MPDVAIAADEDVDVDVEEGHFAPAADEDVDAPPPPPLPAKEHASTAPDAAAISPPLEEEPLDAPPSTEPPLSSSSPTPLLIRGGSSGWIARIALLLMIGVAGYAFAENRKMKTTLARLETRMAALNNPGTIEDEAGSLKSVSATQAPLLLAPSGTAAAGAVQAVVTRAAAPPAAAAGVAISVAPVTPPVAPLVATPFLATHAPSVPPTAVPPTPPPTAKAARPTTGWDTHLQSGLLGDILKWRVYQCHTADAGCGKTAAQLHAGAMKYVAAHPVVAIVMCSTHWGCQFFNDKVPASMFMTSPKFGDWSSFVKRGSKLGNAKPPTPGPTMPPTKVDVHRALATFGLTASGAAYAREIHVENWSGAAGAAGAAKVAAAWKAKHPGWDIVHWSSVDATLLTTTYFPRLLKQYTAAVGAVKTRMLRWMVLFLRGGVIAGTPSCPQSFEAFYAAHPGAIFVGGTAANPDWDGVLAARDRGNPLWTQLLAGNATLPRTDATSPHAADLAVRVVAPTVLSPLSSSAVAPAPAAAGAAALRLRAGMLVSSGCPRRTAVEAALARMRTLLATGVHAGPTNAKFAIVSLAAGVQQNGPLSKKAWEFLTFYQKSHPAVRIVQLRFDKFMPERTPMWDKVLALRAMLERHETVLWIDGDIMSTKKDVDFEKLVAPHLAKTEMVGASDDVDIANTGFVAVRRTLKSMQLLEFWWAIGWSRNGAKTEATTLNPGYFKFVLDPVNIKKFAHHKTIDLFHRCWLLKRYDEQGCLTWIFDDYRALFPVETSLTVVNQEELMGYGFPGKCSKGEPLVHFCCMPEAEKAAKLNGCLQTVKRGGRCAF